MDVRRILHIDMDAFFAAIEQRDNPSLHGKPVIIGAVPGHRGVVSTCSYEARRYGIHSAMPISNAYARCPHGIFLSGNGKKYAYVSRQVIEILSKYSPAVEPVSIDEAYLDISGMRQHFDGEQELGRTIKAHIQKALRLTCSIGIASTRIYAKLATNLDKPDGLTIIAPNQAEVIVYPQPVRALFGIGEKTERILVHEFNITTIGDLANAPRSRLKARFGLYGESLIRAAKGEKGAYVYCKEETPDNKSIGNEHTFDIDVSDIDTVEKVLLFLSQKVGRRLRKNGYVGTTIVLKLRYTDFSTITRQCKGTERLWDDCKIYREAMDLFMRNYMHGRRIRLLGVTVKDLHRCESMAHQEPAQTELFTSSDKTANLLSAIDNLKDMYGESIIDRGLSRSYHRMSF